MGCASSQMSPVWDKYQFRKFLGNGASCNVFLARLKSNPDPASSSYAIKMVKKSFRNAADRENSKRMFDREVSLLRALAHPNILSLIDTMETEDDYILVTEYLAGGEMFGRFASMDVHYSEKTVSHLAKQMLQALFYCHKHHIVHCDLKPANYVFVKSNSTDELKLIDFGLALQVGDDEPITGRAGTPGFMAPEILDNNFPETRTGKILKAADMFSMGVILFMMLAGRAPFDGETDEEANAATLKGEYHWPKEPQVSESAKNLVDNLLSMDYTKRMTASEALNHSWIEHEEHSTISLNSVVARLQTFSAAQMMKKAVASIWRKVMDDEDSHRVRDLFQQLDADGDRILDCEELTSYLQQHGYDDINEATAAAQRLVDSTPESKQRGGLNLIEFDAAHSRGQLGPYAVALRKAFQAFDSEKKGFIELIEIKALLSADAAATVGMLISRVDPENDGRITFDVFFNAMTSDNLKEAAQQSNGRLRGFMTSAIGGGYTSGIAGRLKSNGSTRRVRGFTSDSTDSIASIGIESIE